jgi:FlaA1/EpsC-like NDP-sugar epimerase
MFQERVAERLLSLSRYEKRLLALSVDTLLAIWTVWAAIYLRLGEWVWPTGTQWLAVAAAPILAIPIFTRSGLYRAIFRYTGWPAMLAVVRACLIYGAIYALIFTFISVQSIPRTVGIIQPVLLFLSVSASRAMAHYLLGGNYRQTLADGGSRNVLIYGAGMAGRQLAAAAAQSRTMKIVGFLDDDKSLQGGSLNGIMIYDPNQIVALVERHAVADVLLAVASASRRRRREILELLRPAGVNIRTLPGLLDLAQGRFQISELRPIDIEDLLGRDAVAPDQALLEKNITGKVVLVTGGGGSIGGELCRQIVALQPSVLLVADASEYALYTIQQDLELRAREYGGIRVVPLMVSVLDEVRMRAILSAWRPATIYHAAAYKHVPLVEQNVLDGLKNNIFGTEVVARLAAEHGVGDMVLISTDKAVRPANVMGASKRFAEMILQAHAAAASPTRFSMVRFGNVLGSSGSVVPLFRQQIAKGGPVTITHPDVTRYFMTIPEAAQLVLQAGAMARGGEVFVLDMGEPVRVYDLAVNMIELSGLSVRDELNPDGDIELATVGLRPGEKLYEELLIGEDPRPTHHQRIMQAHEECLPREILGERMAAMAEAIDAGDVGRAIEVLQHSVPEYAPGGEIVDWSVQCSAEEAAGIDGTSAARPDGAKRSRVFAARKARAEA